MTKAEKRAAKAALTMAAEVPVTDTLPVVIQQGPTLYATMYTLDEEREHALNRAVAATLRAIPACGGMMANVRLAVANIKGKQGKGWHCDVANDGTGMVTIDGRINAGRAALARALFGTIYAWTGYDSRELRKLAEPIGFVFGKGRATGWAGDMLPELAKQLDDVLATLPEYPQRFQFAEKKGRNKTGSKTAAIEIHGSPTGDEKINGTVRGVRVFIAQFAADLAKAGYWVSIKDEETDKVLAAAEAKKTADQANEVNKALAA